MRCTLTAAECFHKNVVARDLDLGLTKGSGGWWSMRCGVGRHGKPIRLRAGDYAHIVYTDLGRCPELEVFKYLIKQGLPRECLKKPKGLPDLPLKQFADEKEGKLADSIIDVLFGDGTPAERLVRVAVLVMDGEIPEGSMCDVFADQLRLSPRLVYKATEGQRRRNRQYPLPRKARALRDRAPPGGRRETQRYRIGPTLVKSPRSNGGVRLHPRAIH